MRRNCDRRDGSYWPDLAQRKTDVSHKAKRWRSTVSIEAHLRQRKRATGPEQIVGDVARKDIECVSYEQIYQFSGTTRSRAADCNATCTPGASATLSGAVRRVKGAKSSGRVDINQRPVVVKEKQQVGDLEMDLVIGRGSSGMLLTINDRATGMLKMAILESKEAAVA